MSATMIEVSQTARTPFRRLIGVEWRKMMDTRSGFWLLLSTGLLMLAVMGVMVLVAATDDSFSPQARTFADAMTFSLSILLPVFAIVSVTTEWSQRTHLVTFALEPRRIRVMLAKLVAVLLLALAAMAVAALVGSLGNVLGGAVSGEDPVWDLGVVDLAQMLASQALFFLMAFGIAMLVVSTPGAIALFYVFGLMLPVMLYSMLTFQFDWAADLIPWIDLSMGTEPVLFGEDPTGTEIAQAVVSSLIWVVAPVTLGAWRINRAEVK